jgi:GGDEF domain-containing protein
VAFADLDNFKSINDRFGHQAGDRILQATARILRGNTRETDLIARYGGEEFVVVLPATDAKTARQHVRAHRRRLSKHRACHRCRSGQGDHIDRLRHARRTNRIPTSPTSSRPPIKRCTRPRCAAAIAPCPSIGKSPRPWLARLAETMALSHADGAKSRGFMSPAI